MKKRKRKAFKAFVELLKAVHDENRLRLMMDEVMSVHPATGLPSNTLLDEHLSVTSSVNKEGNDTTAATEDAKTAIRFTRHVANLLGELDRTKITANQFVVKLRSFDKSEKPD